jgi:deoxyhypusine synthase
VRLPHYRDLSPADEKDLEDRGLNRVTDTCIPEEQAFRVIEQHLLELWQEADRAGERRFPHQFAYKLLQEKLSRADFQIDPKDSWLLAAAERNLPMFVPGWEDSTTGNFFVSHVREQRVSNHQVVKSGTETMDALIDWYLENSASAAPDAAQTGQGNPGIGFFQIGGGIAGDFPICVVPLIHQDLQKECPYWGYFCHPTRRSPGAS